MRKIVPITALVLCMSLVSAPAYAFVDIFAHVLFAAGAGILSNNNGHAKACASKFRNYNPATNIIIGKDGKKYKCVTR